MCKHKSLQDIWLKCQFEHFALELKEIYFCHWMQQNECMCVLCYTVDEWGQVSADSCMRELRGGNKQGKRDAAQEWALEKWCRGETWGNQVEETVISDIQEVGHTAGHICWYTRVP